MIDYDAMGYGNTAEHLMNRWRSMRHATKQRLQAEFNRWQDGDIDDAEFELAMRLEHRRRTNERPRFHDALAIRAEMGAGGKQRYARRAGRH